MRLRSRWLQIVVVWVFVSGCVPSACIDKGDLELPETKVGGKFGLSFIGVVEDTFIPAGTWRLDGTIQAKSNSQSASAARAAAKPPRRIRLSYVFRDANGNVTGRFNLVVRIRNNGKFIPVNRRVSDQFFPAGSSILITGTPFGRPLPEGMVVDWQFNYTPDGEDEKS